MNSRVPIEGRKDSDLLGAVEPKAIKEYVHEAVEALGDTIVEWHYDMGTMHNTLRIAFGPEIHRKYVAVSFDRDASVRMLKTATEDMLYKIQEEIEKEQSVAMAAQRLADQVDKEIGKLILRRT